MSSKKNIVLLIFILIILGIQNIVYGKYVNERVFKIGEINIDRNPPKIELISIENSNQQYPGYASKLHEISIKIKIIEKNIKNISITKENISLILGEELIDDYNITINEVENGEGYKIYKININNILGDGELKFKIKQGSIIDKSNNVSEEFFINTKIAIDNKAPESVTSEIQKEEGKVRLEIAANEKIKNIEGWNIDQEMKILDKEFDCNTSYEIEISDFAGNISVVPIKVTKATNIILQYGSLNQKFNWSITEGGKIAGKEAMENDPLYKTEMLSLYTEGNIENDFIGVQTYMHTYWGEGRKAIGYGYENTYYHGYNPGVDKFATLENGTKAMVEKKIRLILGGDGVNYKGNKGIGGNPIPEEIAEKYLYGISSLKIKLKDYSKYSIIYQVWIKDEGWQEAVKNGEETKLAYNKPITAYRVTLVPKSEEKNVIEYWNKAL